MTIDGRWTVTVHGNPATKGSMKCIGTRGGRGHQLIEDDKGGTRKQWRAAVEQAAAAILTRRGQPFTGPVGIHLRFTLPRPQTVTRALPHARGSGDIDKLERAVFDAITNAGLWVDDAQACKVIKTKAYVEPGGRPGVELTLWAIDVDGSRTSHYQDPLLEIKG